MKYSGLYFIPAHASTSEASTTIFNNLTDSIESHFPTSSRQTTWTLIHRLLRAIPPTPQPPAQPQSQPAQITYHHILHLSHLSPSQTYCYIHSFTPTLAPHPASQNPPPQAPIKPEPATSNASSSIKPEPTSNAPTPQPPALAIPESELLTATPQSPGTIITIPSAQTESHFSFLTSTLAPLWQFRHALQIPQGVVYAVGQFSIHVGEVKATRTGAAGAGGAGSMSPGVVVCVGTEVGDVGGDEYGEGEGEGVEGEDSGYVSLNGGQEGMGEDMEEDDVDVSDAEELIRGLWGTIRTGIDIGKAEVREVMLGKEGLKGKTHKEAVVRMWCEVLRLRG